MQETAKTMAPKSDNSGNTRGQTTYQRILAAIQDGIYRPGDALREEEVAARLGVSRTPVREALGRLQEKGLLEAATGRGLAVAILSTAQIFELYAIREELEGIIARFAAHHATVPEIANLRRINVAFRDAQSDSNMAARLNREFHARLYEAARNRYLYHAVEDLQETIALLPETTFIETDRTKTAANEHDLIIEAIERKDPVLAHSRALDHIRQALKTRLIISSRNA